MFPNDPDPELNVQPDKPEESLRVKKQRVTINNSS